MKLFALLLASVILSSYVAGDPLDEDFGYVDVRTGAHMFWVVYHTELPGDWTEHPLILWLQGGPGSSGVGYGNFEELGPYDMNGNLRDGRWTKKANLMFVDNPVGTGYSYVDDLSLLCEDNQQIADDLVALIASVFTDYPEMQVMPFFVYAESYGGKMTADFAVALDAAIASGDITANFQGIAMGDSWISPMDSVNTWGPFLYSMGFVNEDGQASIDASAARTQAAVDAEKWTQATLEWSNTEGVVSSTTGGVNFYNVLATEDIYLADSELAKKYPYMKKEIRDLYVRHVLSRVPPETRDALGDFMNGPQAAAWNIPSDVVWGGQSGNVFNHLAGDFMKPVIATVENLLANSNIHVSVYTGNLDLICDTPGTYMWVEGMDYPIKDSFLATPRQFLHITSYSSVAAYVQRFERFSLFTILRSGHMVPTDAPEMSLEMIDMITQYGAEAVTPPKIVPTETKNKVQAVHSKVENDHLEKQKEKKEEHIKKVAAIKEVEENKPVHKVEVLKHTNENKKNKYVNKEKVQPVNEIKIVEEVEEQKEKPVNKVELVKHVKVEKKEPAKEIELPKEVHDQLKERVFHKKQHIQGHRPHTETVVEEPKAQEVKMAEMIKNRELKAKVVKVHSNKATPNGRKVSKEQFPKRSIFHP